MTKCEIEWLGHRSYAKRYLQLLYTKRKSKKIGILHDGKFYSGEASEHLTPEALMIRKIHRLRYGRL